MNFQPARFARQLLEGTPQKLVVYGTSLSFHFAPILGRALERRFGGRVEVVSSGQPGCASRTGLKLLDEQVLAHRPDTLLMEWAVNDAHSYYHSPGAFDQGISLEESRANLEILLDRVNQALPDCEIILWTTNPTFDVPEKSALAGTARPELERFYQGVREVASARGLTLIDAENFWNSLRQSDPDEFARLLPDGVHPSPKAWRDHVAPFILREMGIPTSS